MVLTPETKTFRDISQNLNEIPDLQREFDWKRITVGLLVFI